MWNLHFSWLTHLNLFSPPFPSGMCHGNSAQPLPVRVDFTKPLPLKATISPCAASSPGGAVVPGQKTWGFWWIFPWMSDGCLIDFDGFVWGYSGFLWFLGGCLWYDSRFFGNFQWIGGVFRQVTGFKAIANPGHVNNLLHLKSRDDPWREWWFNPR